MYVKIAQRSGERQNLNTITQAVTVLSELLLTSTQCEGLTIRVVMMASLPSDYGTVELHSPRDFKIRLERSQPFVRQLATLAHEFIHIAQCLHGRLAFRTFKGEAHWYWEGENWGPDPYGDHSYSDLPWETEAASQECELAHAVFTKLLSNLT